MTKPEIGQASADEPEWTLDRDHFFRQLIGDLAGTLQDVIGRHEARGFLAVVGGRMGDRLNDVFRKALGKPRLDADEVSDALVHLKSRIGGDFYVIEQSPERIVLGNRCCPFGRNVTDRPVLCMMTSNVFGRIAAENLGYARVSIEEAIARGDSGCRVVIDLDPTSVGDPDSIEYFGRDHDE